MKSAILSDNDYKRIILIACSAEDGASEQQIQGFVKFVEKIVCDYAVVKLLLDGIITIQKFDGDSGDAFYCKQAKQPNLANQ